MESTPGKRKASVVPLLTSSPEKQSRSTRPDEQEPRFLTPTKTPQYLIAVDTFLSIKDDLLAKHRNLRERGYATEETENICNMLRALSVDPDSSRLRPSAAFVGLMASGKTGTIGNLVGVPGLAVSMNTSRSGTAVVQHYTKAPPHKDFTELHRSLLVLHPPAKISSLIQENLSGFYKADYHLNTDPNPLDEGERSRWQDQLNAALSFFAPLVCSTSGCKTITLLEDWLREKKRYGEEDVFKKLSAWIDDYLSTLTMQIKSSDAGNLSVRTTQSCRTRQDEDGNPLPSASPLIFKVIIEATGSALLDEGIDLIDRPGTNDNDLNRAQLSQISLQEDCKVRMVVRNYDRSLDDKTLKTLIQENWDKAEFFGIIITKIDLAEREPNRLSENDDATLSTWERQKADLESELDSAKDECARDDIGEKEYGQLRRQADALERELRAISRKIKNKEINIGCKNVERGIQKMFQEVVHSKSIDVPVFFLNNNEKMASASEGMTTGLNGIRELRHYLARVPSCSKLNHFQHLCHSELPHLIDSLDMLCRRPLLERKADVEKHVSKPLKNYVEAIAPIFLFLRKEIDTVVAHLDSGVGLWKVDARTLLSKWNNCPAATYGAFCRRDGVWRKRKGDPLFSWNAELLLLSVEYIKKRFTALEDRIKALVPDFEVCLYPLLQNIEKDVEQDEKTKGLDLTSFYKYLGSGRHEITGAVKDLTSGPRSLLRRVRGIRDKLIQDESNSYLVEYMAKAYEECAALKGKHSFDDRKVAIQHAVLGVNRSGGVFRHMQKAAAKDLRIEFDKFRKLAEARLGEPFQQALNIFDESFSVDRIDDNTTLVLREEFLPAIEKARQMVEGRLRDEIGRIPE